MGQISRNIFGIAQILFLAAVAITLFVFWFRHRKSADDTSVRLDTLDLHATVRRTPVPPTEKPPQAALESGLPTWDDATPPHEVLGVHPAADSATVEKAYRAGLKRYHPDRFASWGAGYQTRAHHVVLLLQKARDRMLVGKPTGGK